MVAVFQSVLLIALMIAIGALLSRTFSFNDDTRQMLTSLIIYIAMPSIILSSIFNIDVDANRLQNIAIVFMLSIIINLTGIGLGWFFATLSSTHATKRGEIGFLSVFLCVPHYLVQKVRSMLQSLMLGLILRYGQSVFSSCKTKDD